MPQDAIHHAIALLESARYRQLIELYALPERLPAMKQSGRLQIVLRRFEQGWGDHLLKKLLHVRRFPPEVKADGTVELSMKGVALGPLTGPIKLIQRAGRWYFIE